MKKEKMDLSDIIDNIIADFKSGDYSLETLGIKYKVSPFIIRRNMIEKMGHQKYRETVEINKSPIKKRISQGNESRKGTYIETLLCGECKQFKKDGKTCIIDGHVTSIPCARGMCQATGVYHSKVDYCVTPQNFIRTVYKP